MELHTYMKPKHKKGILSAFQVLLIAVTVAGLCITFLNLGSTLKNFTLYQSYITECSYPADHK